MIGMSESKYGRIPPFQMCDVGSKCNRSLRKDQSVVSEDRINMLATAPLDLEYHPEAPNGTGGMSSRQQTSAPLFLGLSEYPEALLYSVVRSECALPEVESVTESPM